MPSTDSIFVITARKNNNDDGGGGGDDKVPVEAHSTLAGAEAAAEEWRRRRRRVSRGSEGVEVTRLELKKGGAGLVERGGKEGRSGEKSKADKTAGPKVEEEEEEEEEDHDDEDVGEEEESGGKTKGKAKEKPKNKNKTATSHDDARRHIPDGRPGALQGLKLLFTGTFDHMDRNTSKATAEKYGAEVISNIKNTDYVVLGVKAGQKKIDEIERLGLDTVDEAGFFEMLEKGVPEDKRQRMAAAAEAEPAKKKQKKK